MQSCEVLGKDLSGNPPNQELPVWKGGIFPHLAKVELPVVRDNTQKGRIAYETPTRTAAANEPLSFCSGRIRYRGEIAAAGVGLEFGQLTGKEWVLWKLRNEFA